MKANFISTDGEYLEARIRVDKQIISVMDHFGGEHLIPGDETEVEISAGLYDDAETWETIFNGNPNEEKKIEPLGGWRYRVYGVISSINPVLVDVGLMHLEAPVTSHDERLIGEFLAFHIERLDANR